MEVEDWNESYYSLAVDNKNLPASTEQPTRIGLWHQKSSDSNSKEDRRLVHFQELQIDSWLNSESKLPLLYSIS